MVRYGFTNAEYGTVTNAILQTVRSYYSNLPTIADNPLSAIPAGQSLNLDFVTGDAGVAPSNGATEYYVITIGESAVPLGGLAGQAGDIGNIRNALGLGPGQGLSASPLALGQSAMGVYTDSINQFSPLLTPPDAFTGVRDQDGIYVQSPQSTPQNVITGLTSGNLTFTRRAIGLVTCMSLDTPCRLDTSRMQPQLRQPVRTQLWPLLRLMLQFKCLQKRQNWHCRELIPANSQEKPPLLSSNWLNLRRPSEPANAGATNSGIRVNATDNARLLTSTFNNNTITGMQQDGIAILMNDSAVAEGVTIQTNTITGGAGNGIRLVADGPNAEIHASNTIGGDGINVYGGTSYNQGNTIANNAGDGFQALAANGGLIEGNLINNAITDNGGNGVALLIDNGGTVDFGTLANNRVIRGNTITGNTGAGLLLNQLTNPTTEAQLDATVLGNTISDNAAGGIVSTLNGANNNPPAAPAIQNNNRLNLVVGGTAAADANIINGNGDVGIGVNVTGNGSANVALTNVTVTGTTDGPDPLLNGDGINLRRADSALLIATLDQVTSTNNAGDGINVDVQGSDKTDPNLPILNLPNSVTITDSSFSNNSQNGGFFRTRGDATLITDISNSTFSNNGQNGILVQTSENSSFGDPTIGLPPLRTTFEIRWNCGRQQRCRWRPDYCNRELTRPCGNHQYSGTCRDWCSCRGQCVRLNQHL